MANAPPILIDARDAGRLLDMPPARVIRFANRGLLPCVVLPDGELRYQEDDLRGWVEKHRRPITEGASDG